MPRFSLCASVRVRADKMKRRYRNLYNRTAYAFIDDVAANLLYDSNADDAGKLAIDLMERNRL